MDFLSIRLTLSYKEKPPVLDDFRLEMQTGEVLGLVGHRARAARVLWRWPYWAS